jgi:hypothetical protein
MPQKARAWIIQDRRQFQKTMKTYWGMGEMKLGIQVCCCKRYRDKLFLSQVPLHNA